MPGHNSQQRQDNRLVIGITGRIGAGKTSAARHLSQAHGFFYIRYSQVLSDWRALDPESKAHLQAIGWEVMAGGMQQELNERLISRIESQGDCAVDGLRHPLDFESLSQAFSSHFCLLYVESPQGTRWRRLQERYPDLATFRSVDSHPVEQQIDNLRGKAFAVIDNDGSLQELYSKVDAKLKEVRRGGQT
jgi:dephospho-CoA kinase